MVAIGKRTIVKACECLSRSSAWIQFSPVSLRINWVRPKTEFWLMMKCWSCLSMCLSSWRMIRKGWLNNTPNSCSYTRVASLKIFSVKRVCNLIFLRVLSRCISWLTKRRRLWRRIRRSAGLHSRSNSLSWSTLHSFWSKLSGTDVITSNMCIDNL